MKSRRHTSVAALSVSLMALLAACLPGLRAPSVTPSRSLELAAAPPPVAPSAVFAVVFAAPRGEVSDPSEVSVLFNRPMRPLELVGEESASPARLVVRGTDAAPKGVWRWMGTSALVFAPETRLPFATEFALTVPAGTPALDGETLAAPFEMTFSTPRPHVERLDAGEAGDDQLVPTQTFEARFDQPVDPRDVERAATLTTTPIDSGEAPRSVSIHVSRPDPTNAKLVKIVPASQLPLASKIALTFDATLRGTDGPLPMREPRTFDMKTYGPLEVVRIHCWNGSDTGDCPAGQSVHVQLSNSVPFAELRAHLRITPAAAIEWSTTRAQDSRSREYYIPATLRAGASYHVTVKAGMRDEHGQALAQDVDVPLTIGDLMPSVVVGLTGTVLEASSARGRSIPVTSMNTASYALLTGALDEPQVAALQTFENGPSDRAFDRLAKLAGVKLERVTPGAPRNTSVAKQVPIETLLADRGGRGAFVVATENETKLGSVTDLALTGKMSRFGSLVWVTRLSDGKPVAGATVSVRGKDGVVFEGATDGDGLAAIPADRYEPANDEGQLDPRHIVVARLGDDWSWRRANEVFRWGWSEGGVYVDASGGLQARGMLFTDRGVYRPGEAVELEAIFRQPTAKGTETPAGSVLEVEARDAEGATLFQGPATLDAFGVATLHVPLPPTAHLGQATLEAKMPGGREATTSVLLAAYKASEFKASVDAAASAYSRGDEARFDVHGDYLFGAPMGGAKVHWTVSRGRAWFSPPGADDFAIDDDSYGRDLPDRAPRGASFQTGDGALDAHGAFAARIPLALEGQRATETVTLEAEVEDVSRETVASRASTLVHPASFYVGLRRPKDWFLTKADGIRAEVIAVDPRGQRRTGAAVHVELVRRVWTSVLQTTGETSGHWESRVVDAVAGRCDVVSAADAVQCVLPAAQPGYYLVRAHARDEKGREVSASYDVYVLGEGGEAAWAARDGTELSLVADKKTYEVGDVARVLVKSPFREADALVTVERTGIYRQERVHLVGATPTLRVPITEDLRPNAFVSVHLVRGRSKAAPAHGVDAGAPAFKSGVAQLVVDPESRRLQVALKPAKKEMRPGQQVEADVAVTDTAGKPVEGELTLWAVDEGVLMLTGYATPDPIPTFTAPRSLAVFGLESRADLARIFRASFSQLGVDKGDEGGGGGSAVRADFRATAWFEPGVKTGMDGRTHVSFKLPDNLTTFRVMAVAVAKDDRFGHGETQVTTSRPLMLRPALPRFLRAGDAIEAGVIVSTKGMPDSRIDVAIAAEGATVAGDTKRAVDVRAGQSVEVRWAIATPRTGSAKMSFTARGGGEGDAVQVTRRVDSPASLETVALEGETREASAEKLGDLGAIRDDVGSLEVRLSSTALLGVGDGMDQLLEYPYGCTEQLTSRLVPLLAARDLARDFGVALSKDPDGLADAAIVKILANQRADGGFGWWPESVRSDPWVTAYALWGLDVGKKAGRPVPDDAIDRAVAWLRSHLDSGEGGWNLWLVDRAFMVDVLAEIGKPDPGFTNRLYEKRADLPLVARALLAHAIVRGKMDRSQAQELLRDLEQHLRITPEHATVVDNLGDDYAPVLDSQPRTTAILLRALVALDPKHVLAPRLARGLLGAREHGKWRSTHEAAWALLALDDYRHAFEAEEPNFDAHVWVAGQLAMDAPFRGRKAWEHDTTLPMAQVLNHKDAALAFQVDGSGELFYEARLRYARKEMPHDDVDRGFYVRKLVRAVTPEGLRDALGTLPSRSQARVRAGDRVLVDLVLVTTTPREQVVLDDPLPAGLEPVDASLATTAQALDVAGAGGTGDDDDAQQGGDDAIASGRAWGFAWYRREMHDDRVLTFVEHMPAGMYHYRYLARATTVGKFVVPPTRAECMYDPAVFGRTAGSEFQVTAP